ncbi:hypothetical protein Tco_1317079 [Tanacetum coccineum]
MNRSYSSNVLTESYEGASPEMRQHKSFGNVTVDHLEDIMVSPLLQEKSLKSVFTGQTSFAMHAGWSKFAMHVNEPAISLQGMKHLKSTSKSANEPPQETIRTIWNTKALISDRGTHFCNYQMEKAMKSPINWDKPPKNEDGAWHAKIRLINPDGEEFTKTLQSVPTSRKLFERKDPREIIDLDHFYDT